MSETKFNGIITVINETNVVSDKFQKREFVVTDNSMYPQQVMFELVQDNVSLLDSYKVGDDVSVSYNLNGRPWTNPQGEIKFFNTLKAWKIEKVNDAIMVTEQDSDLPG
jgi:hypothetical protein